MVWEVLIPAAASVLGGFLSGQQGSQASQAAGASRLWNNAIARRSIEIARANEHRMQQLFDAYIPSIRAQQGSYRGFLHQPLMTAQRLELDAQQSQARLANMQARAEQNLLGNRTAAARASLQAQTGLIPQQARLQGDQIEQARQTLPLEGMLTREQLAAQRSLLPEQQGLATEQLQASRSLLPAETGLAAETLAARSRLLPQQESLASAQTGAQERLVGGQVETALENLAQERAIAPEAAGLTRERIAAERQLIPEQTRVRLQQLADQGVIQRSEVAATIAGLEAQARVAPEQANAAISQLQQITQLAPQEAAARMSQLNAATANANARAGLAPQIEDRIAADMRRYRTRGYELENRAMQAAVRGARNFVPEEVRRAAGDVDQQFDVARQSLARDPYGLSTQAGSTAGAKRQLALAHAGARASGINDARYRAQRDYEQRSIDMPLQALEAISGRNFDPNALQALQGGYTDIGLSGQRVGAPSASTPGWAGSVGTPLPGSAFTGGTREISQGQGLPGVNLPGYQIPSFGGVGALTPNMPSGFSAGNLGAGVGNLGGAGVFGAPGGLASPGAAGSALGAGVGAAGGLLNAAELYGRNSSGLAEFAINNPWLTQGGGGGGGGGGRNFMSSLSSMFSRPQTGTGLGTVNYST